MRLPDVVGYLFDFGVDVLVTVLDKATGVITAQLGDSTTDTPDSDNAEWWQHTGFASRPAQPTQGGPSCQALILKKSDRDIVFATRDTRGTKIYANLDNGETCVYAAASQARELFKKDGSVRQVTTDDNTETGNTVFAGVSATALIDIGNALAALGGTNPPTIVPAAAALTSSKSSTATKTTTAT